MPNARANGTRQELYVVEVDGVKKSEHRIFVEALKCGMELKIRYPRSNVKLRDADHKHRSTAVTLRNVYGKLVAH